MEDACTLDGLRFRFIDTAGLRDTDDVVEAEGIRRALAKASSASTVLLLLTPALTLTKTSKPESRPSTSRRLPSDGRLEQMRPCRSPCRYQPTSQRLA